MEKVSIILINYGTWEDTIECCESIKKNSHTNYHVITVDVTDKNNSFKELHNWHNNNTEHFELLKLDVNNGFAYGNNYALQHIINNKISKYVWVLNNDTVITPDALINLLKHHKEFSKTSKIAFTGSKIMDYNLRDIIQTVGATFNEKTGYSKLIGKDEKDEKQYDNKILKPDYVIGASMFFHTDLIKEIGYMPEDYFMYCEDADWCLTAKFKGYTNYVCTESVIYHKKGKSTGNKYGHKNINLDLKKYMYSCYLKMYRKHFKKYMHIAYLILFKQFAGRIYHLQFKEAVIILKTIFGINK